MWRKWRGTTSTTRSAPRSACRQPPRAALPPLDSVHTADPVCTAPAALHFGRRAAACVRLPAQDRQAEPKRELVGGVQCAPPAPLCARVRLCALVCARTPPKPSPSGAQVSKDILDDIARQINIMYKPAEQSNNATREPLAPAAPRDVSARRVPAGNGAAASSSAPGAPVPADAARPAAGGKPEPRVKAEPGAEVKAEPRTEVKAEHRASDGPPKRPNADAPAAAATELEEGEMPDDVPDAKRSRG